MVKRAGVYPIGNLPPLKMVEQFGTPLYVYDQQVITSRYKQLAAAIKYQPKAIYYAAKANSNPEILNVLKRLEANIECVSRGEVELALKVGFKPSQIIYTCSNIDEAELKFVIERQIRVNLDSLGQIAKYGKYKPGGTISIRLNQNIGAGHHEHVITGGPDSKFGIDISQIDEAKALANRFGLKIVGLHQHIGSNILDVHILLSAARALVETAWDFKDLEFIDFGGGLGVPYRAGEKPLDLNKFGKSLSGLTDQLSKHVGRQIELVVEPGRYLVAEAGSLLVKVTDIKRTAHKIFVGVNSGFNHLLRPALYAAYHEVINLSRGGKKETVSIAGNICESGDVLARDRALASAQEGDILAILTTGAYGYSMSSNYNLRPKPAEVLVSAGKATLIRKPLL